jgi:copper(I)-binding protein
MQRKDKTMYRLFTLSFILFVCLLASNSWAAPKLMVEQPSFDFGEVVQGQMVPHLFKFKNAGDEPLVVEKVRSSCGCTAVLLSSKTLAPGESGEVKANFNTSRFRGLVTKTISLYSNDPQQPVKKLTIQGTIQEILSVVPTGVNFGQVKAEVVSAVQVTLQNHGKADLSLKKVQTSSPDLVVKPDIDTLSAGQSTVIDIQLTPSANQDRFSGYVIIPAQGVLKSDLRIPVNARIRP